MTTQVAGSPSSARGDVANGFCDNPSLRATWHVVALSQDIGEQPLAVKLLGDKYVLWRSEGGGITAAPDRCPHREAPLSEGTVKAGVLTCPYHGWSFGSRGQCVAVPSSADPTMVPARANLRTCEIREAYGLVWLCPGTPEVPLPVIAEESDQSFHRFNTPMQHWKTSVTRMVDNFMDTSHFAYVHDASIGAGVDPVVERIDIERLDDFFTGYAYESVIANPEAGRAMNGDSSPTTTVNMTTGFCLPFSVRGTMGFRNGTHQVLLITCTPVDEVTSLFTFVIWRNDDEPEHDIVAFELQIQAEDQRMLELFDTPLPLETGSLVSVRSDKASEYWRRELIKFMSTMPGS